MIRRPPRSTLFPNPTLSRSVVTLRHTGLTRLGTPIPCRGRSNRPPRLCRRLQGDAGEPVVVGVRRAEVAHDLRSEEHTSELQSRQYLVCRLLLEKKKITTSN